MDNEYVSDNSALDTFNPPCLSRVVLPSNYIW